MKATHPAILLALVLGAFSCSRTGDLSGDLFITDGGKPLRGAGVEILIIPASDRLEAEFRKTIREYDQQYGEAIKREEQECEKDRTLGKRIEEDPALQKRTDEYAKVDCLKLKICDNRDGREVARYTAKSEILIELGGGKCPFNRRHRDVELDKLIHARAQELGRTREGRFPLADANGHYEVNGLAVGRYYLSASMDEDYNWLVPVQIVPGAQKVHLSNANSGSLRFLKKEAALTKNLVRA